MIVAFSAMAFASGSEAGVYADDLSRCLVEKTMPEDKVALVKWMFTLISVHPSVATMTNVTPEQLDASNKAVGELFMKLLTESCREETKRAIKYEGPAMMHRSFEMLGRAATAELFASPEVKAGFSGVGKYVDEKKLQELRNESTQ